MGLISKLRKALYKTAKTLGDADAIVKGTVVKRVKRRIAGKLAGKALKKL